MPKSRSVETIGGTGVDSVEYSVTISDLLLSVTFYAPINVTPHPPCTGIGGDRWGFVGICGDLIHRMCQIPHPSITIQCQIPTLYIYTRICAGTRANACADQKLHPWGVISWRIPYQAPPLSPTGGGGA